jgi:parvulin-like peptidyl-prolyl isomerase
MIRRAQFLKEPLLHFLVIGAALFGAYAWVNRDGNNAGLPQVRLAESDVRWLKETFALERRREPTEDELRGLVRDFVKEALLARQAQELGLDKDDIVVRRRLAQKMTFLLQDNSRTAAPSEDDLHRLYEAQRVPPPVPSPASGGGSGGGQAESNQIQGGPQTLFTRPRISFKQIFFSRDQRADAAADAREALRQLSRPDPTASAAELGDRVSIKSEFRNADERAVANQFGAKFAARVFALAPGSWQGPLESGQGVHLVRITERVPAQLRPFDEIRGQLVEMWRAQSQRENEERYIVGLLKKYQVVPDESVKALVGPLLDEQGTLAKGVAPKAAAP